MDSYQMFIGGQWCSADSGETYDAVNPATEKAFAKVAKGSRSDARRAIAVANEAQESWSKVPLWERAGLCVTMGDVIAAHEGELADILCTELGKPRHGEALDEAKETPVNFRNAAAQAKWLEGSPIPTPDPNKRVLSFRRPRGVVGVITPWNFPAAIPGEYLPYAIVMGNTVVWTPAPTAAVTAVKLMEYMIARGVPQRTAHHAVGELVAKAMDQAARLADLELKEFQSVCPQLDDNVYDILGPDRAIEAFQSFGSTAPKLVADQIADWKQRLST